MSETELQAPRKSVRVDVPEIDVIPGTRLVIQVWWSSYRVTERHLARIIIENRGPVSRTDCEVVMTCNGVEIPLRGKSPYADWQDWWATQRPCRNYGSRDFDLELENVDLDTTGHWESESCENVFVE